MASLKIAPADWKFLSYDLNESEAFKAKLIELGFNMEEDEIHFWDVWRKERMEHSEAE